MTNEQKLIRLKSYVCERMDLHGDWWGKINVKEMFEELETELEEYRKLKSALHPLIERLWVIDSGDRFALIKGEKKEIINTIAYRIANEWID